MKILILTDRASAGGGIHNYYSAIKRYLRVTHEFSEVGRPHAYYGEKIPLGSRWTGLRLASDWLALVRKIVSFRPDIVHINPSLDPPDGRSLKRDVLNLLTARLLGCQVLVFWRGWDNGWCGRPEFPGGNRGWLCRLYKQAARHVVLASRFKDDLLRWGFTTPIDVETTVVADECLPQASRPVTNGAPTTNLLYLSRIEIAKGVFELLDAYHILKARNPAYTLTVAGDGPALEALRQRAAELGLRDVSFPGYLRGEAKNHCYRQGSIFCFLSYSEGMPNAVLEAMAMGLPIVSSDAGGLRDILADGRTGYVLPPAFEAPAKQKFRPEQIADAIDRLAQDPLLCQRISQHNARYARERFAAAEVARRLDAIYADIRRPGPPNGNCPEPVEPPAAQRQNT